MEDLKTNVRHIIVPPSGKTKGSRYLHIKRSECGIAANAVSRSNEVSVFVNDRIRKARADVENWRHSQSVPSVKLTPEDKTIRRVPGQTRSLVCFDYGILKVAKIRIEVVKISFCGRVNV